MNKKTKAQPAQAAAHDWMAPIDPAAPCGVDLEYDPEFVVLFGEVAAKADAQYGDFVGTPEPVNWSEVDRDCKRLMMRGKDIRLGVLFTRCRTRLHAAAGLAEGLNLLAAWLHDFPESIHPQPGVDEDKDAALEIRMNALQALTDAEGLLADVRDIALARSSIARLQVRDVERAFAQPRPSDALSIESVMRQLEDVRTQQPALIKGFDDALEKAMKIDAWNREHLGVFAADLSALTRLLRRVVGEGGAVAQTSNADEDEAEAVVETQGDVSDAPVVERPNEVCAASRRESDQQLQSRDTALQSIREARHWFETHEPSSPVPVLLRRAEQFVGKSFAEAVKAIPAELLAEWDKDA